MCKIQQKLIFSIVALLILPSLCAVQSITQLEGLEVNTFILANINHSQSQVYIHNFENSFLTTPQLALTIIGFQSNDSPLNASFHIIPQTIASSGFVVAWERNIQKWMKISLNYIASVRNDIILGCQQKLVLQNLSINNALTVQTGLIPNYSTSILRTFLLGCNSNNSSITCGILPKMLANTSITITLQSMPLQNITITFSYLIFSPSTAAFTSYGGYFIKENYMGPSFNDLHKTIAYTPYRLQGFTYLSSTNLGSVISSIDDDLILSIDSDTSIDKFAFFYIILGKTSKEICYNSTYQYHSECLDSCPDNTYAYTYSDSGQSCRRCSDSLNMTLVNGVCATVNKTTVGNQTSLLSLFLSNNLDQKQSNPHENCSSFSIQTENNNSQQGCPQVSNQQPQQSPQTQCPSNSFLINGYCLCQVGYSNITGTCSPLTFSQPEILPIIIGAIRVQTHNLSIALNTTGQAVIAQLKPIEKSHDNCSQITENSTHKVRSQNQTSTNSINKTQNASALPASSSLINSSQSHDSQHTISNSTNTSSLTTEKTPQVAKIIENAKKPVCGNGIIEFPEECDDLNTDKGDGCDDNCKIEKGFKCEQTPSKCTPIAKEVKSQIKTNSNTENGSLNSNNLQLVGSINANNNQIYLTLDTITPFNFPDAETMKTFLKTKFTGCAPPTSFCSQQSMKKNLFDCLFLFPSGVPNKSFTVEFSYAFQSKTGGLLLQVDALKAQANSSKPKNTSKSSSRVI